MTAAQLSSFQRWSILAGAAVLLSLAMGMRQSFGLFQPSILHDTAITTAFRSLKGSRPYDLAIMPVGAYNPWIHAHCTPEQAWQMANDAGAEFLLPVYHQTFTLGREPYLEPIERIQAAAGSSPDRVAVKHIGQEFRIS